MKSVWKIFLVLTILVSFSAYFVPTVLAVNLNYCATLNTADTKYVLTSDVSHNDFGSCMRVVADNIILDCADNTIIGPSNKNAIGVNIGADNFTMYNCTINQFNQSVVTNGNHTWPTFGQNFNRTGTTGGVASGNGTVMWNYSAGDTVQTSPTVVDGVVYFGSEDGEEIYAIFTNGTHRWNYSTNGNGIGYSSPAIVDDTLYIGTDWALASLWINGTFKWNYTFEGIWVTGSPTVVDGVVYFATNGEKNIYAVYTNGTHKWNYSALGEFPYTSPVVVDGVIYVGSSDNNTYAIYTNGTLKWNYSTSNVISSTPAVVDNVIYIVSDSDYKLYAIYTNGTLKWTYSNVNLIYGYSPAVVDGVIYIGSIKNSIFAIYTNGTLRGNYSITSVGPSYVSSSPAVVDGVIYATSGVNIIAMGHSTANATGAVIHNNTLSNANVSFVVGGYNNTFYDNYMSSIDLYYFYDVPDNGYDNHFNTTNSGKGAGYQAEGNYYDDYYTWKIIDSDGDGFADSGGDWPYNNSQTKWFGSGADWGPIIPGSAPAQPFVAITPSSGVLMDYFNCTFNHSDANNNPATITAKWINGTTTHSTETFTSVAVGDDRHIFLRPAIAHKGETWSCYIRACDAGDNCGEAFKNVTIGNSKPSLYEPANDSNTLLLVHFDEEHLYGMEGELGVSDQTPATSGGKTYGYIDTGTGFSYLYYNNTNGANLQYAAGTVEMWVQPQWDATDKAENVFFDTTASESWWSWFFTSRVRLMKD
ncbi:MAG: PQQ-binding-like beta-propeller repeat protein, partial [Nanoarchaeota archaeon]|nr:PQQ-binding-like beta-propeller repeat protein [Nanoarchaeota archaeon]